MKQTEIKKALIILIILIALLVTCVQQEQPQEREDNLCGYQNYGKPTFEGTPREGEGCIDDLDCELHPSVGYQEGEIHCCQSDGTCWW